MGFAWLTISVLAQNIEPIYSFTNSGFSSPRGPLGDLILGRDGNLYGTTQFGGGGGFGTVFKVTPGGVLTVLATFGGQPDGATPYGGVALGPDGNLYGTTYNNGAGLNGTVFRVTTNGVLTTLHSFSRATYSGGSFINEDGAYPYTTLTPGPDGYFYGTTSAGGTNGWGTAFKMTATGALTTIFTFGTQGAGLVPQGALTWGPDGNLYGTTHVGGAYGAGTAFRLTTNGVFTKLVDFAGTSGVGPEGALRLGPDGNLYGTTLNGGIYGKGTIFKLTTNGVLTTLVSFNEAGVAPETGLTLGPDGNLYGTTSSGNSLDGSDRWGTVFRVTTNGVLTTLAKFGWTNGSMPQGGVAFGPDGDLYGTAYAGGSEDPNAAGVIYRLRLHPKASITMTSGGAALLHLPSLPGSTNLLWVTTNLNLPMGQWQVLATNVATNGFFQFADTNINGRQMKFYRLSTRE